MVNLDAVRIENKHPEITNAGVLLFAKDPQRFLKSAPVVCALYQGNEKVQILDRKIYNEGLLENIEQAHEQSSILIEGLSEGLKKLLKAVQDSPDIQAKDLAKRLSRPIKTIDRQIKTLTDKDLIERRGSKKTGGYWMLSPPRD